MAKMKGMDFKALLLNHGEKLGAAVVALLALTGLATANWSGCKQTESELLAAATKTRDAWLSPVLNAWPVDKKKTFEDTPDVVKLAQRMASPNEDIESFATSRHWNEPINPVQDKLAAVTVLPPESPEANVVTFTLVEKDDGLDPDEAIEMDEAPDEKPASDQDLRDLLGIAGGADPNAGAAGGLTPGLGGAAPGLGGGYGSAPALGGGYGASPGGPGAGRMSGPGGGGAGRMSGPGGGGAGRMSGPGGGGMAPGLGAPGLAGDMSGGMGMGMDGGMGFGGYGADLGTMTERKVRSSTGVSVRFVFDMRRQTQLLADALHLSPQQAGRYIDFVEFQIERKKAIPGVDPWAGEWEPLSLEDIGEILERSLAFDMEIVNPSVVRSEITMPLPLRAAGRWTPAVASHTRLEEFKLSPEEQELINKHQEKLIEEAKNRNAMLPPEQAKNEGFRRFIVGSGDLGMALGNASSNAADSLFSEMSGAEGNADDASGEKGKNSRFKSKEEMEKFLSQTLVSGRLLLLRFMDFTCDRGNSYIYRVRLEMKNPNFNRPVDELEQPELATQKSIFSEWSEPTEPAFVPNPYRYYVDKVDSRPRADEVATISMYFEHETAGTPVMASNLQVHVGTRMGGKQPLEVVDLGKSTLQTEEVELRSRDFLASVTETPRVSQSDFPELRQLFKSLSRGSKPFADRITVVDASGAIVSRFIGDSVVNGDINVSKEDDHKLSEFVLSTYEHFRPEKEGAAAGIYGDLGEGGTGSGGMGAMGPGMGMGPGMDFSPGGTNNGSALGRSGSGRSGGRRSNRPGAGGGGVP